jgi:hypothetical protein
MGRHMAPPAPKVLSTISGMPWRLASAFRDTKSGMLYCQEERGGRGGEASDIEGGLGARGNDEEFGVKSVE